jgi:alanine dehydrogenase
VTLVLARGEIAALMRPADYLAAVESAFRAIGDGRAETPAPLTIHGDGGAFHGKGARLDLDRPLVALKLNGNFPGNPLRGLPTIQGAILLCDATTGALLAILDSIEVTIRRTAAATALAARHLARRDSAIVTICGCGAQAAAQLEALRDVLSLTGGYCVDQDPASAARFAAQSGLTATADLSRAAQASDVVVTCTPSTASFLTSNAVRPGAFIAAVGADAPHKSEIDPALVASATVVVDSLEQCAVMGDLHHAIESGAMTAGDIHAELADVVAGRRPGRTNPDQVTLFDSTGIAAQDVASAAIIYERALSAGVGQSIDLAA